MAQVWDMVDLEDTRITNRSRVQPNHANNLGTAHGGIVLKWMDEVGAMSAMRFAHEPTVTAHIDRVDFASPLEIGDIALIDAYVYKAGRTSVQVRVRVDGEDPLSGSTTHTTESHFVFVAVDDDWNSVEVPELRVTTETGRQLQEAALENAPKS